MGGNIEHNPEAMRSSTCKTPGSFDLMHCTVEDIRSLNQAKNTNRWQQDWLPNPLPMSDAYLRSANGSELVIDQFDRIKQIKDGSGRQFRFGYDDYSDQLNSVTNEDGTWRRQPLARDAHSYSNIWENEKGQRWQGDVQVSRNGYAFADADGRQRCSYDLAGTKTIEYLNNGQVYRRDSTFANGDGVNEALHDGKPFFIEKHYHNGDLQQDDLRTNVSTYKFPDGRTQQTNLNDHSSTTFDTRGRMIDMQDAAGRKYHIGGYDNDGKPANMIDADGSNWVRTGANEWQSRRTGLFRMDLKTDPKSGSISYSERPGQTVTINRDGSRVEDYCGMQTTTSKDGSCRRQYSNGDQMLEPPVAAKPEFTVKHGTTIGAKVRLNHGSLLVAGDGHANIRVKDGSAVGAFQDGLVMFTSRDPHMNGLSGGDVQAVENLRSLSKGQDFVVVQCYDPHSGGIRYELYTGLSDVNVRPFDRVKQGQPLGRVADGEFNYELKRGRPSGDTIRIQGS